MCVTLFFLGDLLWVMARVCHYQRGSWQSADLSRGGDTKTLVCCSLPPELFPVLLNVLYLINSLAPGRFQFDFRYVIFKLTFVNGGWGISHEITLRWMPLDLTDDKSTLVQVMAWCRQATSHYLSQCWPTSMSPNGVTRSQWVKHFELHSCLLLTQHQTWM